MSKKIILLVTILVFSAMVLTACGAEEETTTPTTSATSSATTTTTSSPTTSPTTTTTTTTTTSTSSPTTTEEPDKYGGIFKLALTVGPATPLGYPAESAPDASALASHALESLIRTKSGGIIEPLLATAWEVDPDALTIRLHLREGVKFHDGTDFNADAVKWNWEKVIEAERAADWESVEVIDDYTVLLYIKRYTNIILTGLAGGYYSIISPTAAETNGLDWARNNPVGTGPFKFVEYERDFKLVFERNDDYWDEEKPYLDGLEYVVIADATVRKMAFQRGDIHRLSGATGLDAQELSSQNYVYVTQTGGTMVLIPDSANPDSPFADIRVRKALSHAIDREALAEGLGFGFARPAYQLYPGFDLAYMPDLDIHEYDLDKARQLLADAGVPDGFSTTIHTFTRIVPQDYITAIAAMLGEVGIVTEPDFPEAGKYTEYRFGGWNNALMGHGYAAFENLNSCWSFYFTGTGFPSFERPDSLMDALNASLESEEVDAELIKAAIREMHDNVTVIPYLEEVVVNFYLEGVHDPGILDYPATVFIADLAWLEPEFR